ncbi:hypothetical protein RMAECT_0856 [Rickettsia rhipicephali str. Ect]|uniref:Uncharacterized protein n=1 Tax=Rickettsia rhipicephali str. Ect TaxID=1359199 RepID=A0A0F3PE10_RICRH|nr:hypothetical protein RMAECT_0856 [Rickettsia rhipicephali str. Ect]
MAIYVHSRGTLLRESKNALGVIPWLDHGIQKAFKKTRFRDQVS